jgi:hypothetical protein
MEETCSSETLVDFERTTLHYIPEDIILYLFRLDLCFLFGLFFDPEDGGDMFLRNVG